MNSSDNVWKGSSMESIHEFSNNKFVHFPHIAPSEHHKILFKYPQIDKTIPPVPHIGDNKWDSNHVHLPCSSKCQYPIYQNGIKTIVNKWSLIEKAFENPIKSSYDLEKAILSYNIKYKNRWNFKALHVMFRKMDKTESDRFFNNTLPNIIKLALQLPKLIQTSIPLLRQHQDKAITFSQQQVACLLANAFLCTYPRRNTAKRDSEYRNFPDINFNTLFSMDSNVNMEKIKCICSYFVKVLRKVPTGVITMKRRSIKTQDIPNWKNSDKKFTNTLLHISAYGKIEDDGRGLLQVDFANKYVGGGILNNGCVQEEIRFAICPELIISKLFMEKLHDNEVIFMIGCERYSDYIGYANTFKWAGPHEDNTPMDNNNRRECCIVAIDALYFHNSLDQFAESKIVRELNKAYIGFYNCESVLPAVASGNWGCGAFRGDKRLKAAIQLMVCCTTNRPLVYYTFGDENFVEDFNDFYTFLVEQEITIGTLYNYLTQLYSKYLNCKDIYQIIYSHHLNNCDKSKQPAPSSSDLKLSSNSSIAPMETIAAETETSLTAEFCEEEMPMQGKRKYSALDILNENYEDGINKTKCPKIITVDNDIELINDKNAKDNALVCDSKTKYSDLLSDNNNEDLVKNEVDVIPGTPPSKSIVSNGGLNLNKTNRKQALLDKFFTRK